MTRCYAEQLGDCRGRIELEHVIPQSVQRILGPATIEGFAWQRGKRQLMSVGAYAKARILCAGHHDQLDGLDGIAARFFRNLMLASIGLHVASGDRGRVEDWTPTIDGRGLERWLLKTVCGMIAASAFDRGVIQPEWLESLFNRAPWADEIALHVLKCERMMITEEHCAVKFHFVWARDWGLNGIIIHAFGTETWLTLKPLDAISQDLLHRPFYLAYDIQRPRGGEVLAGLPAGEKVRLYVQWPILASRGRAQLTCSGLSLSR